MTQSISDAGAGALSQADLKQAVAGIARVMAKHEDAHGELTPALLILTEALIDVAPDPGSRRQRRIERLAELEREMLSQPRSVRMQATMGDMGISRSYYFELRAAAIEQALIPSPRRTAPSWSLSVG